MCEPGTLELTGRGTRLTDRQPYRLTSLPQLLFVPLFERYYYCIVVLMSLVMQTFS